MNSHTCVPKRGGAWLREELLRLLSLAATLAGFCIAGVALFHTIGRAGQ